MISIIIPVYNAEQYLERCIDSVLAQTYSEFELILVDDGSVDKSSAICDEYACKDSRVKVIHKPNGGVSSARNEGLEVARGEWITFIDSDDMVFPKYLENFMNHTDEEVDLIISSAVLDLGGTREERPLPDLRIERTQMQELFARKIATKRTAPWSKFYRNSIIQDNHITFDTALPIGEDAVFLFTYILHCNVVVTTSDMDYLYYVVMSNSLTKRRYEVKHEKVIMNKIYEATEAIISTFSVDDGDALNNILTLRQSYVRRVLDSIYFVEHMNTKERLAIIKSLPRKDMCSTAIEGSMRAKVLAFLLRIKAFVLYDLVRHSISTIRK